MSSRYNPFPLEVKLNYHRGRGGAQREGLTFYHREAQREEEEGVDFLPQKARRGAEGFFRICRWVEVLAQVKGAASDILSMRK